MTKPKFRVVTYPNGVIVGWAMNNAAFDFAIEHFGYPIPLLEYQYVATVHNPGFNSYPGPIPFTGQHGFILNREKV